MTGVVGCLPVGALSLVWWFFLASTCHFSEFGQYRIPGNSLAILGLDSVLRWGRMATRCDASGFCLSAPGRLISE